jgi:hypothetical protein
MQIYYMYAVQQDTQSFLLILQDDTRSLQYQADLLITL